MYTSLPVTLLALYNQLVDEVAVETHRAVDLTVARPTLGVVVHPLAAVTRRSSPTVHTHDAPVGRHDPVRAKCSLVTDNATRTIH